MYGFQFSASQLAAIQRAILPPIEPAVMAANRDIMKSIAPSVTITAVPNLMATTRPIADLIGSKAPVLPLAGLTGAAVTARAGLDLTGFTDRLWSGLPVPVMSGWLPTAAQLEGVLPRIDLGYAGQVADVVGLLKPSLMTTPGTRDMFAGLHETISGLLVGWDVLGKLGTRWPGWACARPSAHGPPPSGVTVRSSRPSRSAAQNRQGPGLDHRRRDRRAAREHLARPRRRRPCRGMRTLRKETTAHRRGTQPLWDRKVSRRHIALLEEPVTADRTLSDLLIGPDVRAFGQFENQRVVAVLDQLSERDREIAMAYSRSSSWDEAAATCDATPEEAESVRRKLKYRGKQLGRTSSSGETGNDAA
ncbi:hypothetical protein ACFWFQ_00705 [Nocardia salmonicida]|uniref:hypothetical protein n=1 Tax=Nocardia salmonicida TaxID=53431 RepID=UPI003657C873